MNSNIVKPEKFGILHLVYHFTIPLNTSAIAQVSFILVGVLCKFAMLPGANILLSLRKKSCALL